MNLSERIQKLRKEKGLSQESFADELHVSRQAVSKWENNQSVPDTDKLIAISNLFDVSIDYLLKGEEKSQALQNEVCTAPAKIQPAVIIFAIGVMLCFMLPLIASLYQGYEMRMFHSCFTDANEYIFRFPILGITIIAVSCMIIGIVLLVRFYLHKNKQK